MIKAKPMELYFKISQSQLNRMIQCPAKWYLKWIHTNENETKDKGRGMTVGNWGHDSIHLFNQKVSKKPKRSAMLELIDDIFENEWEKYRVPYMHQRKKKIIKNFKKFLLDRMDAGLSVKPTFSEKEFFGKYLRTKVDAYYKEDKTIIEYKTSKKGFIGDSLLRQGKIEEILTIAHKYPVKRVLFVFLTTDQRLPMPNVTKGFLMSDLKTFKYHLEKGNFPKKKSNLCEYCEVRLACELSNQCLWW